MQQAIGLLDQLDATLDQAKTAVSQTDASLGKLKDTLNHTVTDVAALRSSGSLDKLSGLFDVDPQDMADFMSSPVEFDDQGCVPG